MKALVTGGGGFLGQAIVRGLIERGAEVSSFSRSDHRELSALGVGQIKGDLSDATAISGAVQGFDVVFHVAAKPGIWGDYADYYRTNVTGTRNVIEACRRHGVGRLIYASSPSVVFDGRDMEGVDESVPYPAHYEAHYPRTKALAEQMVLAANDAQLATVCLRPHLIWGPGDNHLLPRLVARARANQLRRIGSRSKLVDTIYVDNAAEAHLLAAERLHPGSPVAGRVYFVSQGEPVPLWDIVNRLLHAVGAPPVTKAVPVWLALWIAGGIEAWRRLTNDPREPRVTRFVVRELSTAHWFDISAARRDLGYAPRVSIAEGLSRLREVRGC
ncbi:MAG: 3-beta hydroxysteroid dehydrogenase [Betaproteobacteria bacterium RIFCSPLOWO2_02_FULL_63_19]|nr:MAG: 3-beta hydroxysteroid dehydrogenase [Betaproteobacteria bacterium RIFCSPLOWO2_02_FULL_63_19]